MMNQLSNLMAKEFPKFKSRAVPGAPGDVRGLMSYILNTLELVTKKSQQECSNACALSRPLAMTTTAIPYKSEVRVTVPYSEGRVDDDQSKVQFSKLRPSIPFFKLSCDQTWKCGFK